MLLTAALVPNKTFQQTLSSKHLHSCRGCRVALSRPSPGHELNHRHLGLPPHAASATSEAPSASAAQHEVDDKVLAAYKALQNGSDIRGVAVEGYEGQPITLFPSTAYFIGRAFAEHLSTRLHLPCTALRISVGRDPRISGPMMVAALLAGIASTGANAISFGISTTPAMFMSCVLAGWQYDGGIMVTASHLPYNRNGMKFCTEAGGFEKADITDILNRAALAASLSAIPSAPELYQDIGLAMGMCLQTNPSLIDQVDFLPSYAGYIQQIIRQGIDHPTHYNTPLEGWNIVVNAGNGSGGFFVTQVLQPLGANTTGSLNLEPNGMFPAHIPNPEDKTAMAVTVDAVLRQQADLGIVFDTDVDRSGVVDADGTVINKNRYIALMAAITLRTYPGSTIVTCSTTSNGLTGFIEAMGGRHMRFKKGYRNVIGKGIELNKQGIETELMMETSGHGAMRENYFLDDGAYAVVKILIECVKRRLEGKGGIGELLAPLPEPAEAAEYRLKITSPQGTSAGKQMLEQFKSWVDSGAPGSEWKLEEVNYEGWRVAVAEGDGKSGWLLLRASLHDPQMVLNVESEVQGGVRRILQTLERFLQQLPNGTLDAEPILRAIVSR